MNAEEIKPFLTKFVTVVLDDFSEVSGYIANPDAFKTETEESHIVLVNGLQNAQVPLAKIIEIHEAVREETTEIPIIGDSAEVRMKRKEFADQMDFNNRLDELLDKSLSETLEVTLPNGKTIDNSDKSK